MKVLVINASANRERSATLRLTKAFLEGLGEEAEFINTIDLKVNPCRACYACWFRTNGQCVQKDDAAEVMEKIRRANVQIWSVPLYAYGAPSHCKALMDRTLCFNSPKMYLDGRGLAHHYGYEDGSKRTVLISTAGLPNVKGNFDGLVFQMKRMYGENTAAICCADVNSSTTVMDEASDVSLSRLIRLLNRLGKAILNAWGMIMRHSACG